MCAEPAVIDIRRHNANFCAEHFLRLCRDQTAKSIAGFSMLDPDDRLLVAVSGGKDSLAVWDILIELGYDAEGYHLGLGIGEYSRRSEHHAMRFADARGLVLHVEDLRRDHGFDVPNGSRAARRAPCSACGLSKRHLPAGAGFPKKVKPLVRLTERETAAYCILRGIEYLVEECPMASGNKHLAYKTALNDLEVESPVAKHDFYFGFLREPVGRFRPPEAEAGPTVQPCARCGAPTSNHTCAFCGLQERACAPVPIALGRRRPRRRSGR